MRGEDSRSFTALSILAGSPPHARGRLSTLIWKKATSRITPACAGKTLYEISAIRWTADHPRMRGEDKNEAVEAAKPEGSPPHARGRLYDFESFFEDTGITPACAGKTPCIRHSI